MSYEVRLVQSRLNTGVEFSSGSEITTRLEEWKAGGKIEIILCQAFL